MHFQPLLYSLHGRWPPATGGYLFSHGAKVFRAKVLDASERAGLALPEVFAVPPMPPLVRFGTACPANGSDRGFARSDP